MPPAICWSLKMVHPIMYKSDRGITMYKSDRGITMYKSDRGITQPSSKVNKLVPIQNAYVRKRGITQP